MAHLSRTRRLNLGRLETQPPDDVTMVHTILLGAVKDIQDKVRKVGVKVISFIYTESLTGTTPVRQIPGVFRPLSPADKF